MGEILGFNTQFDLLRVFFEITVDGDGSIALIYAHIRTVRRPFGVPPSRRKLCTTAASKLHTREKLLGDKRTRWW